MSKYLLPSVHLSWSAISMWMSNKERFQREYFEGGRKLDTKFLRFGKGIAKLIEELTHNPELKNDRNWVFDNLGLEIDDPRTVEFFRDLVIYDTPEYKLEVEVCGVPTLGYIDTYDSKNNIFRDDKTGKHPWNQAKVQKHDQLPFYAMQLKHKIGKMPEKCYIDWIETKEDEEHEVQDFWRDHQKKINITGRIVSFEREFDEREIERMENLLVKCAEEISEAYTKFLNQLL